MDTASILLEYGYDDETPAWKIAHNAGDFFNLKPDKALKQLMKAFHDYGRSHWRWAPVPSPEAGDGGILFGITPKADAAAFRQALKRLAEIFGIGGIKETAIEHKFLSVPRSPSIDGAWHGNVRSSHAGFADLQCFHFASHSWLTLEDEHYDPCHNRVFKTRNQAVWTRLLPPEDRVLQEANVPASQLYRLARPLASADYLIRTAGKSKNEWTNWQLAARQELKNLRRLG
ncbi:MAG: hypothetical protein R2729_00770 [Bryobacteraceae bacterium]